MKLKECSTCLQLPKLHIRHYARSFTDATIVSHYSYVCDDCQRKYLDVEGTCHQTFEWKTTEDAAIEWNEIVDNNNSWYKKEYQQNIQLKII